MTSIERRTFTEGVELRNEPDGTPVAAGYASVFESPTDLGGFTESVGKRAFEKTLKEADVLALFNHEMSALLGRSSSGTLRLSTDSVGLRYELDLPDTALGRDVATLLARGDLKGSSFGFRAIQETWKGSHRTLTEVALRDVGPVTVPAYADTSVALRSLAEDHHLDLDQLIEAAKAGELDERLRVTDTDTQEAATIDVVTPRVFHRPTRF